MALHLTWWADWEVPGEESVGATDTETAEEAEERLLQRALMAEPEALE